MNLWRVMITLHAIAGFIAFGTGILVLSPSRAQRYAWGMVAYIAALIGLVVFTVGAMASHWPELSQAEQIIFPADLGAPAWVVVLGAVAATLGGNRLIELAKKAEAAQRRR